MSKRTVRADYYEKTIRKKHRNRTKEIGLDTRLGKIILNKPQLRETSFVPAKGFEGFSSTKKYLNAQLLKCI